MKLLENGNTVAHLSLDDPCILTDDEGLEEMFYQLVDEGIPTMSGGEDNGTLYDEEIRVTLSPDTVGIFSQFMGRYGYEVEEDAT